MALIFVDGMDQYDSPVYVFNYYDATENLASPGNSAWASTGGRFNGPNLRLWSLYGGAFGTSMTALHKNIPLRNEIIVGMGYTQDFTSGRTPFDTQLFRLYNIMTGGNGSVGLTLNSNGILKVVTNTTWWNTGTVLGYATASIQLQTFPVIEMKVVQNISSSVEVRVNNRTYISASNLVFSPTGGFDRVAFLSQDAFQIGIVDDIWIMDTSGSAMNTFLGNTRVYSLFPSGSGSTNAWVASSGSNFGTVKETTIFDSDTTYVASDSTGSLPITDLYQYQQVPSTVTAVKGLNRYSILRKEDGGTPDVRHIVYMTGSTFVASASLNMGGQYTPFATAIEINPFTGLPWTTAEINAMQAGVRHVG